MITIFIKSLRFQFKKIYLLELLFIIFLTISASLIYLKPIFDMPNNYILLGGADDSTYGILTQKVLQEGIKGAYDLTFPPLLPILMALFHKLWTFSIEDAGRIITSLAIILSIIPTYLLARYLFGIKVALVASVLILTWPMSNLSFGFARPQALQTFIMTTAFLVSYQALKKEKLILYFSAGLLWGLSYLTRFESWLPFLVLLIFTLKRIQFKIPLITTKKTIFAISGFLAITYSYLSFVHSNYGSWTINPRIGIDIVAPGGAFSIVEDERGLTTLAQLMLSQDSTYYQYSLWHPKSINWLIAFGRNKIFDSPMMLTYFEILKKYSPEITHFGFIGILLSLFITFRKNINLFFPIAILATLIISFTNLIMRSLANLGPFSFPHTWDYIGHLYQLTFVKYRDSYIIFNSTLLFAAAYLICSRGKKILPPLLKFIQQNNTKLFLPISLYVGNIPLLLHSIEAWYIMWIWPILIIYAAFPIIKMMTLISHMFKKASTMHIIISLCIIFLSIFLLGQKNYLRLMKVRSLIYQPIDNNLQMKIDQRMFKDPGLKILADHGQRAKVAVFKTTPVFYAQGRPFFFIGDNLTPFDKIMEYFYNNEVDYIVATQSEAYAFKNLQPLFNPKTKLTNWELFYIDPPDVKYWHNDKVTNVVVTIWKRKV